MGSRCAHLLPFADHGRDQADQEGDSTTSATRLQAEERASCRPSSPRSRRTRSRPPSPSCRATSASTTSPPTRARPRSSGRRTSRSSNNVRDLLAEDRAGPEADRRRHLRHLRPLRQADREGAHQGAALRRPLHQGRAGAVAPVARWIASAVAARPSSSAPRRSSTCSTALTKLWAERTLPDAPDRA